MDAEEYDPFFRSSAPRIESFLRRRVHSEMARDLTQEVFFEVWTHLDRMPDDPHARSAWLHRTARFKFPDALGKASRRPTTGALTLEGTGADPGYEHVETAVGEGLLARGVLAELTPEERRLWWMVDTEGFSRGEIAEELQVPYTVVTSRIHRLNAKLVGVLRQVENTESTDG